MAMLRPRAPRLRNLPLNSLAPNILTTLALCSGLTSIRFSLAERWQLAVVAILVAAIFDALDGRLARLLKGTTKFGAELDSLSDFLCFGVAPVLLMYLWTLESLGNFGWLAVLAFAVACALRLARFNTALDEPDKPVWMSNFFTGVPAPMGAALALLPMMLTFAVGDGLFRSPYVIFFWCICVGFLMVSRIPTFSGKKIKVRRDYVLPLLFLVGVLGTLLATEPWITLSVILVGYLCLMPLGVRSYRRQQIMEPWPRKAANEGAAADADEGDDELGGVPPNSQNRLR